MVKRMNVYIDTSVFGAIFDTEDPFRVDATKKLLATLRQKDNYRPFISNILLEEVNKAPSRIREALIQQITEWDFEVMEENEESAALVRSYIEDGILNIKYRDDARHVALSVVNNVDIIVSWNCKHLSNVQKKRRFNAVNLKLGYHEIDIITPLEVDDDG